MGNMRDVTAPRSGGKAGKRRAATNPVSIADRLQGFIGKCTTTDTPPDTSENYKEMLRVAIGKKHSR